MKTTAIYTSAIGPEERDIAARMWGRAFETHEKPAAGRPEPWPRPRGTPPKMSKKKQLKQNVKIEKDKVPATQGADGFKLAGVGSG